MPIRKDYVKRLLVLLEYLNLLQVYNKGTQKFSYIFLRPIYYGRTKKECTQCCLHLPICVSSNERICLFLCPDSMDHLNKVRLLVFSEHL